jgi:hypothetical protein
MGGRMSKLLLIDADTILYAAAQQQQSNQCLATNIAQQRTKLFESKTAFNEWAKENNRDKSNYSFETVSEITGEPRFAFQTIKQKIDTIVEASGCKDYRVCIQGDGNFRKFYESKFVDYKGQRTAKPLLFHECFDYMEKKYKAKCIVSKGQETDDYVNIVAWNALRESTSENLVVAYCDKDITANGQGQYLNYNKLDKGVFWQDEVTQYTEYWTQVICGDSADNLMGLEAVHKDTKAKYGIKTNGAGPVAASKLLNGITSEKEAAERVMEAYSLSWPEDWFERLSDNAFFLYLRRKEDEMFNFKDYMESLK